LNDWSAWVGREERRSDRLDLALAARWLATFDLPAQAEGAMPQGIHFCLCTPDAVSAALGEDGHPTRDDGPASFLPPVHLPRRMWAGSDIEFFAPIAIGAAISRTSRVAIVNPKVGKSGPMVFVYVEHQTFAGDTLAVRELQTLVYRAAAAATAAPQPPPLGDGQFDPSAWQAHRTLTPEEPLLFRFSALTFNSHRIHYDEPYARAVEGYRGLVVHGPLMASLLLQLAEEHGGRLRWFNFQAKSPAIVGEPLHLVLRHEDETIVMGVFAGDGRQIVSAEAKR